MARMIPSLPPPEKKKKAKPVKRTQREEVEDVAPKSRHPETEKIEQLLIEGAGVAQILEQVEVSAPTVYVIRARLRKEGKIQ